MFGASEQAKNSCRPVPGLRPFLIKFPRVPLRFTLGSVGIALFRGWFIALQALPPKVSDIWHQYVLNPVGDTVIVVRLSGTLLGRLA